MAERRAGRRAELVVLGGLIVAAVVTGLWSLHLEPATTAAGLSANPAYGQGYQQGYGQTWTTRLADTTCDDWVNRMTPPQRSVAATRLLTGSRARDGQRAQPASAVMSDFESEISRTCLRPTSVLTDVAGSVYASDRRTFSQ